MPSKTSKQARTMRAAAHNPMFAKKLGIPQKVAQEFNEADQMTGHENAMAAHVHEMKAEHHRAMAAHHRNQKYKKEDNHEEMFRAGKSTYEGK